MTPEDAVSAEELIEEQLDAIRDDLRKFYTKGNKSAGTRARVGLLRLNKLATAIRGDILDMRHGAPSTIQL